MWEAPTTLAAPANAGNSCNRSIALIKTHKTGSATVAGIVFQSSVCSMCTLYDQPQSGGVLRVPPSDSMLSEMQDWPDKGSANRLMLHISAFGPDALSPFAEQRRWLAGEGKHERALVPGGAITTSLREPVTRWLSHILYFEEPALATAAQQSGTSETFSPAAVLVDAAKRCSASNVLAAEFGLRTADDVSSFLQNDLPKLGGFILLEEFELSAVLMALRLGLRPEDLVHFTINSSGGDMGWLQSARGVLSLSSVAKQLLANQPPPATDEPSNAGVSRADGEEGWEVEVSLQWNTVRWDQKRVFPTPKRSSLGPELLAKIEACIPLDFQLYNGAVAQMRVWEREAEAFLGKEGLEENRRVYRAALDAVRGEVRRRLEQGEDTRPALSNMRTVPDQQWMLDPAKISLSGLLTINEMDRNAMLLHWNAALAEARGVQSGSLASRLTKGAGLKIVKAYKEACNLRDKVVLAATEAVEPLRPGQTSLGFRCPTPAR